MQRRTLWLIIGILGICATVTLISIGGLLAMMALLSVFLTDQPLDVSSILQATGLIALGLGIGVPLVLAGWAGWQEKPSRPFNPSRTRWVWLALPCAFLTFVALGAAIGWLPRVINLPIPASTKAWVEALLLSPVHVLAMSIPSLLMLGLAGWGLRGTAGTQRDIVTGMTSGGCLGMGISMVAEILVIVAVVIIVMVAVILIPGGVEQLYNLSKDIENPAWQEDVSNALDLLLAPAVVIPLFGIVCVLVPLMEEAFKTLGIAVAGPWVRPRPGRAFLWGVAAGAGFALAENLLNGAAGSTETWAPVAVARVGATAMHCLSSGMLGWGWGQLWTARRPARLVGIYIVSVTLHGLWNALALGMAYAGMIAFTQDEVIWKSIPGLAAIVVVAIMGLLSISFLVALFLIARRLATRREERLQDNPAIPQVPPTHPQAPTS
jgi:RsiW-degrading membrane proteinase PrsW (M82 family)